MLLYNTLSGTKEDFKPLEDRQVRMYVCGPTVYDYDHVGHARTYISFDLLNRFLRFLGYKVKYVQNITDVGHLVGDGETGLDKVRVKAQETGVSVEEIIDQFSEAHRRDLASLQVTPPDLMPRASEHIKDIITFVEELITKGFAYQTREGNVYFRVSKKADYGKLSHRGLAEIITGTRIEPARDKTSPADFALWKAAPIGAKDMVWDSPWGKGFPGWHIECSAMSQKYLGNTFDIHGSAIEHIFPHHENEIAQSEALTGQPLAKYWVHTGLLTVGGQKMSKSLKNTVSVADALKDYSANELRLAFFLTSYRRPFDYTKASLEQGVVLRRKLFTNSFSLPKETDQTVWKEMIEALNDDLDTPKALQVWEQNSQKINETDTNKLFNIFGLIKKKIEDVPEAVGLAADRNKARANQDFLTADNRKNELFQHGFEVLDTEPKTLYISR